MLAEMMVTDSGHRCQDCEDTASTERFEAKGVRKAPNAWGLYDMSGNAEEWVWDVSRDDYEALPTQDPRWSHARRRHSRVIRGGSWYDAPRFLTTAVRNAGKPGVHSFESGLRVGRGMVLPPASPGGAATGL